MINQFNRVLNNKNAFYGISVVIGIIRISTSMAQTPGTIEISQYCTSRQIATDITICAQRAINAAAPPNNSFGGSIVHFPANLSPYTLLGTLTVPYSFVTLEGDNPQGSSINCNNGANDCVQIGYGGGQTRDQAILKLGIVGYNKTGGNSVSIFNTYNVRIENSLFDNMVNGVNLAGANNSATLRDVTIVDDQPNSQYGIYWHDRADGTSRSDVLTVNNVVIEGNWSHATGFLWDGAAYTVAGSSFRILHQLYGMHIMNSARSQSYYPQYLNIFDMELEGFTSRALEIDGGTDFKIVGSDVNNLLGNSTPGSPSEPDEQAIAIFADTAYSYTRGISIVDSRIGDSRYAGLYSEASDLQLSNDIFFSTSGAGPLLSNVIQLASSSRDVLLSNIKCEEYGGLGDAAYCIEARAGAQGIIANTIDARYVRTSAINDLGSKGACYVGILLPNGQVITHCQ
jgi:hypothetical protein